MMQNGRELKVQDPKSELNTVGVCHQCVLKNNPDGFIRSNSKYLFEFIILFVAVFLGLWLKISGRLHKLTGIEFRIF